MNEAKPNSQYNLAAPDSLAQRAAYRQRQAMYRRFLDACGPQAGETILDVGVTSDRSYKSSNYLELWHPDKAAITAAGIDDAAFLVTMFPGMRFVRADGLKLPFKDKSFDVVHSSAVLEHVGSAERQAAFIAECARVARRALFMTTPNRWFPVEVHTRLPLVHWLPDPAARRAYALAGKAWAAENHLLGARDLRALFPVPVRVVNLGLTLVAIA